MTINGMSLPMTGTYASYAKILALQSRKVTSTNVLGRNFTDIEINMNFITSLFMSGGIVFISGETCKSELKRIEGKYSRTSIAQTGWDHEN